MGTQTNFVSQTVDTTEVYVQTDLILTEDKETKMEETPTYTPLVERASNQKLSNELNQVQHELAQYKKELVPLQEHQALLKRFNDLATTEDEAFSQLREERVKG